MYGKYIWTLGFRPHVFSKASSKLPAFTSLWNSLDLFLGPLTWWHFAKRCCFLFFITDLWEPLKICCKRNYYSGHLVVCYYFVWKSSRFLFPEKKAPNQFLIFDVCIVCVCTGSYRDIKDMCENALSDSDEQIKEELKYFIYFYLNLNVFKDKWASL